MLRDCFKSRQQLEAEILILQRQLNVLQQRAPRRLHLRWVDRALFIWLYRRCPRVLDAITIVRSETVVRSHRMGFAAYWRWKSRSPGDGSRIGKETRDLIRRMSIDYENHSGARPRSMASCSSSASRSPNPRFRSIWCRGGIDHCRPGRTSFAITWRRLRRLICLLFQRLRFSS
jgi:hypothetical protein